MGRHRHIHKQEDTDERTDVMYFVFPEEAHHVRCATVPCEATFLFEEGPAAGWVWHEAAGFTSYECPDHAPTCTHEHPDGEYAP